MLATILRTVSSTPTVMFDSSGAGAGVYLTTTRTLSWNHTRGGSGNYVIVAAGFLLNSGTAPTWTASYGGTAMTLLKLTTRCVAFGLFNPPSGAQQVDLTASSNGSNLFVGANSMSFVRVVNVASVVANPDSTSLTDGGSPSVTLTTPKTGLSVMLTGYSYAGTPSGFQGQQRFYVPSASGNAAVFGGTAQGTGASQTLTVNNGGQWGNSIGVSLTR